MSLAFDTRDRWLSIPADEMTLIAVFGLSATEAKFLKALLEGDWVGKEGFPGPVVSVRQMIYTLRKKVEQQKGWIINDGQGKYAITPAGKVALAAKLRRVK